jgi:hypothetical protein
MLQQLHLLDLAAQTHRCSVVPPVAASCSGQTRRQPVQAGVMGHSAPQPSTSSAGPGDHRRPSSVCRAATADVLTPSSSSSGLGAPVGSPPPVPGGPDGPDEFYPNFGEAVKVLREDLPQLFERDLQWHIYREDITFRWVAGWCCSSCPAKMPVTAASRSCVNTAQCSRTQAPPT